MARRTHGEALNHGATLLTGIVLATACETSMAPAGKMELESIAPFGNRSRNSDVPQYAKGGAPMAKVQSDSVYRIIDVVGVSETS